MKEFFLGLFAVIIILDLIFIIALLKNSKDKEE